MPDPIKPGNISFDLSFKKAAPSAPADEDAPLRIAILGDFSGRNAGGSAACQPLRVDCDNFDSVCARFGAEIQLPPCAPGTPEVHIRFGVLDDFHPDHLIGSIPALAHLAGLRANLSSSSGSDAATAELRALFKGKETMPAGEPLSSHEAETASDMLSRLLGRAPMESAKAAPPKSIVENLIRQAASPSAVPAATAEQTHLLSMLDAELSARLRRILHHPAFQALESAWRGLDFLVREAGDSVKLHALDISRDELDRQLASLDNAAATMAGRALEQIAPCAVLGGYSFGAKDADALRRIARLAGACRTAFIGGAAPGLAGCASFGTQPNPLDWAKTAAAELNAYAELRRAPESSHIGLALPRFLLRQPYGRDSDPIRTFPFEELPARDTHECYLWGNAAFLCGRVLLDSFAADGWDMELGGAGAEIGGLPVHSFTADGEKQTKPCAEAWLPEKAADVILSRGLMPVLSVRGRDSVLLVSLRSLSDPASPLSFRRG